MLVRTLAPFRKAIADSFCAQCAERGARGSCCRPGGDPCVLRAHTEVLVDTVTTLGRGKTADEIAQTLARRVCTVCPKDDKGYCSLSELLVEAPDNYIDRLAEVILTTHEALGAAAGPSIPD